ncbi:MAG: queuosine precursor transporter [Clostridiales bacterium]|jgi:uncharacterized integral membrane protein (TIGR00697 family)|nr:queuosine precursor transporter [Clostridiales bacterium]
MGKDQIKESIDKRVSVLLLVLVVIFVSFMLMSNILANNMIQFWIFSIDAGTLTFPITYVLSDVFSEVYGYKWSRRVTWYAAGMNLLFALFVILSVRLPHPAWFDVSPFQTAIGSSLRIVLASIISYVAGDYVNDKIFRHMKKRHSTIKGFGVRAIASSVGGSIVDTTLFVIIAFTFIIPSSEMVPMIGISVVLKLAYELLVLPITRKVAKIIKAQEEKYAEMVK